MKRSMLTTVDNPFNPFDDWDAWFSWDTRAGYHSSSFLARVVISSDELSEADLQLATEKAIDEIVFENVSGMWRKVVKEFPDPDLEEFIN